jgi:hypothetical protein
MNTLASIHAALPFALVFMLAVVFIVDFLRER